MDDVSSNIRKLKEPEEAINFLKNFKDDLEEDLIKIITAQSFQDLTGQTLKKVIKLVGEIEEELVRVIKTFGIKMTTTAKPQEVISDRISQSEVDDLLKNLGF